MDWPIARARFEFLAHAYEGTGGFKPLIKWQTVELIGENGAVTGTKQEPLLSGQTELVRYPRESEAKFAARNAVAVYENHHRAAVERFGGFLGRRRPTRDGVDAPLAQLFIQDADQRGNSLDLFLQGFALQFKARGTMLVVVDMPEGAPATSLADQVKRRRVPYVRVAHPEAVKAYRTDADTGLFLSVTLCDREWVDDVEEEVERDYDTSGWRVRLKDKVLRQGVHKFGACPVLYATENGDEFPVIGNYAQIADLSRRLFNARSERDEILRSQTFSLLTLQVPAEQSATFNAATVSATIGTHSMLVHAGDAPAFIAPDVGPAQTYRENIDELQQSIRRISKEDSTEQSAQAESGVARRLRFEALNSEVATFARQLQKLELQMWTLFKRAMGSGDVSVSWPTDYNLADVMAEIDILTGMQLSGFPPRVLNEKRRQIAATEFDNADDQTKAELKAAIDELDQVETPAPGADPNDPTGA